jgi:hypothetical protein
LYNAARRPPKQAWLWWRQQMRKSTLTPLFTFYRIMVIGFGVIRL